MYKFTNHYYHGDQITLQKPEYWIMRILITSGGTKVPMDPVRHIQNMSTGRFGSELAREALNAGIEVIYLASEEAKSPFSLVLDVNHSTDLENDILRVKQLHEFSERYKKAYHEYRFRDFHDYFQQLKYLLETETPDIVILAAAVSDYLVEPSTEKMCSSDKLSISLQNAPKVINQVKSWSQGSKLMGFKLLVDAPDSELVQAALRVIANSGADVVIANNLSSLQKGAHEVLVVQADGSYKKITSSIANYLIQYCKSMAK